MLRADRDIIIGIDEKNRNINSQMSATNSIVGQMTRKEFMFKLYIMIAIVLLFGADLCVLLFKTIGI